MSYKLRDVVDSLEFDELVKMKKDLDYGGFHLKKFVESKVNERAKKHEKYCAVCANELKTTSTHNFTLVFGPDDFRKKASFDAVDCLLYFIKDLKNMKKVVQK